MPTVRVLSVQSANAVLTPDFIPFNQNWSTLRISAIMAVDVKNKAGQHEAELRIAGQNDFCNLEGSVLVLFFFYKHCSG